jgi:putative transposase
MRYVERNPLRAGLVKKAQAWPWSSLAAMAADQRPRWLAEGPVDRPRDWIACVNVPQTPAELEAVRQSIARGRPFGSPPWTRRTAARLGIETSLRPRGRPRKRQEKKPRKEHEK